MTANKIFMLGLRHLCHLPVAGAKMMAFAAIVNPAIRRLLILVAALWLLADQSVQAVTLTLDQPEQFGNSGNTLVFSGKITNDAGLDRNASDIFINLSGFAPGALSFDQLLGSPDFLIHDGTTSADTALFDATINAGALDGRYFADVQLEDVSGNLSNIQTISIQVGQVPEPSTLALLSVALATFAGLAWRRRRAQAPVGIVILALVLGATLPADAAVSPVQLGTGDVGISVWPDSSIALAVPIVNLTDSVSANNVTATRVTFGGGTRANDPTLPLNLGAVVPGGRVVLNTRFTGLAIPGRYLLTISGTYQVAGQIFGYSVNRYVQTPVVNTNPANSATSFVRKQFTTGGLLPQPIPQENDNNPSGPPIPPGPFFNGLPVPASGTTPALAGGAGQSVDIVRDTRTNQTGNFPPDPSAATAPGANVVFVSGNTYALFSADGGQNFTRIDPTTIFPAADGGLCCDQVILYVPRVDLFFWLLQYNSNTAGLPAGSTLPGPNRLRVAFATPASMKNNINAWTYVDLTSADFNLGNQALDFPDLAATDTFLYASVDRVTSFNPVTSVGSVNGLIVSRMSLADLANPAVGTVGIGYFSPTEVSDMSYATGSRLTQNSRDAMYWAGHVDQSRTKIFRWADNSGSMPSSAHQITVNSWCNSDYTTLASDNQQWLDSSRTSGSGAVIGAARRPFFGLVSPGQPTPNGEVWFAWGAARDSGSCTQGRPQPYVKIVRVDDGTLDPVGEYHIWNPTIAFAYPALAVDPFTGEIGVSVAFGGGGNYATTSIGYINDFVVYYTEPSDVTLTFTKTDKAGNTLVDSSGNPLLFTRFGDYLDVRNVGSNTEQFASQGYAVRLVDPTVSTGCTTGSGCTFHPRYEQWGRPPAPPPR